MSSEKKQAELIKEISGVNPLKCMKCGKCSATCPSYNEMDIKPHQFVSYVINEDIESLVNSKSLWKCLSCFACVERCPRKTDRRGKTGRSASERPGLSVAKRNSGITGPGTSAAVISQCIQKI